MSSGPWSVVARWGCGGRGPWSWLCGFWWQKTVPLRLDDLATSEVLDGQCDQATVYRLLKRLEENGLIRRLGLHERAAYYVMQFPGEHGDYLICRDCGSIERLQRNCPVEALEKEIAGETGYLDLQHELEFFGTCPACAG